MDPESATAASLLGLKSEDSPAQTALRVGTASHALDYDDLAWAMDGHPSVALVPGLLAVADEVDASGRDLLTAYAAGYEVACAVAEPIGPEHYESGWHATATFGTIGAAAAVVHLLDLDTGTTRQALNVAASMPAGLKRNFGSTTKPLHAGLCSRSGITAATVAEAGGTADPTAISGDRGFWDLYGPAERGAFDIGDTWTIETEGINIKAYPCCYFTHAAIVAAESLAADGLDPEDIQEVEVTASQGAADALQHEDPETGLEVKFSMEYTVASGLVRERTGLAAFEDDNVADPAVQRVRERVSFAVDDSLPYDVHEGTVRVVTADGTTHECRREDPPGTHGDPLSDKEFQAKFFECAGRVLDQSRVESLYDTFASLEAVDDVTAAVAESD